jgi:hypothetical protein
VAEPSQFSFVQFEFPWAIGPPDGRYVVRTQLGGPPEHVLVVRTLGAPQRHRLQRRRGRPAAPEPPPMPVATTRVTVIGALPFEDADGARTWLEGGDFQDLAREAVGVVNRAIAAHRAAAQDPLVRDVASDQALITRAGYGAGEEVADGRWTQARELAQDPPRGSRRSAALRPGERLAALLGAREEALVCEEPALAARAALDGGRLRAAALLTEVALRAGVAELGSSDHQTADMAARVAELSELREAVEPVAEAALVGEPDEGGQAQVSRALERLEAAVRARVASGPWR